MGKMRVRGKEDGVPRLWSFGISRSRRRSDSAWDGAPPQFHVNWLILRLQPLDVTGFLGKDFLSEAMRWGSFAGDDDVVRRDGAMPVHV